MKSRYVCISLLPVVLCVTLLLTWINGVDAGVVTSRVIPSEAMREGLGQVDPCPGDMVEFTCTLNDTSASAVRWTADGAVQYTFLPSVDVGATMSSVAGLTATFINATTLTLLVSLSASAPNVVNGTEVGCVEVSGVIVNSTKVLTIIGPASAPTVTVRPGSLSTLTVDMTASVYGRECVDLYRATAVVGGMTLPTIDQPVTDPNQVMYTLVFPAVDLCRDMLTNVTAVAVTNGMEGTMATPFTTDVHVADRSRIITSPVSALQFFTSSGINVTLNWQVIDEGIITDGFNVTCQLGNTSLSCSVADVTATQLIVSFPLNVIIEGQVITFNVGYSYELCINDVLETMLTVDNINSSPSQEVRDQRAVRVEFSETLFDVNTVRVMFSSNCTSSVTVDYSNPLLITIPDTRTNTGQCQYNIQLVDRATSTLPIGYPITGFFNARDLPPPPTTPPPAQPSSDGSGVAAAAGGGAAAAAVVVIIVIGGGGGGGYAIFVYKKNKGGKKDKNIELEGSLTNSTLIGHETAPGGDEYAVVPPKTSKPPPPSNQDQPDSFYQDPNSIDHQKAPETGDLYAVTEKKPKKGSKKGPSDDELTAMYSVPDKSKKNPGGLTYASLDMPGGSGGAPQLQQTEYASVIN